MAQKTNQKNKNKKSTVKKGKVTVSPVGLISLCGGVIICCLILLLVTTIAEGKNVQSKPAVTKEVSKKEITQKENSNNEVKKTEKPVKKQETKQEPPEIKDQPGETTINLKELKTEKIQSSSKQTPKKNQSEAVKKQTQSKTPVHISTLPEPEKPNTESKSTSKTESKPESKNESKIEPKQNTIEVPKIEPSIQVPEPKKTVQEKPVEIKKDTLGFPVANNNAQLCILLDDGGQNLEDLKKFLALKIPLTVAVLPKLRDSVSSANAVRAAGCEVMLHQPMQAINLNVNPGPGAIKPDMDANQIRNLVLENLREVGPVSGMNNHEGSLITADVSKMETVIDVAHMQGIYFLDSRTNIETKIPYVSRELGYGWYERNGYFLDNQKTREEFLKELRKNLDIANKTGCVIMIAHVWSASYMPDLIREVYPELVAKGYSFKTVGKSRGLKN